MKEGDEMSICDSNNNLNNSNACYYNKHILNMYRILLPNQEL